MTDSTSLSPHATRKSTKEKSDLRITATSPITQVV
jgi:hypothetical protein